MSDLWKSRELKAKLAQIEETEGETARLKAELAACEDLLDKTGKTFDRVTSYSADLKKGMDGLARELDALARRVAKAGVRNSWQ